MHYVVLGIHDPAICPTANAATRQMLAEVGPQIPAIAEKNAVKIVSGPFVNREHMTVAVVEAQRGEDLDRFIVESKLAQWNTVRILPSHHMVEAMQEMDELAPLF